jgi:hypothetical protein
MATFQLDRGVSGLSAVVCGLVRDVRRVIRDGRDPGEISALKGRIGQLREEIGGATDGPLLRYLDALQSELHAA